MSIHLLFRNWKRFHVHVTQHARYSLLTFFVKNSLNGLIRIKSMMICNGEEWKKREILQFTVVYKKWKCLDDNMEVETYNDAWWAYAKICDASSYRLRHITMYVILIGHLHSYTIHYSVPKQLNHSAPFKGNGAMRGKVFSVKFKVRLYGK